MSFASEAAAKSPMQSEEKRVNKQIKSSNFKENLIGIASSRFGPSNLPNEIAKMRACVCVNFEISFLFTKVRCAQRTKIVID